ncbi:VOC family protein [Actinoplanes aureus]|uniref:VOC family protein n=1 Tax=Actinoplanes aureus TaxID=2792083 RepID=A0A931CC39_9ACTN|nr:VOC family protein [Actinoplanes aureus]MBG0564621.1 VOC family protein [Actinoplanes aureus]
MELFVDDMDASIAFYSELLGFRLARRGVGYAVVRRGHVVLGIGLIADTGWAVPGMPRGAGVEVVLELDEVEDVAALYEHCAARVGGVEPLQLRSWGLYDFRLRDPDGYYLRVTHGDAYAAEPDSIEPADGL